MNAKMSFTGQLLLAIKTLSAAFKKYTSTAIMLITISGAAFAQADRAEQPLKSDGDTLFAFVNRSGEILNLIGQPYYRKWWPEGKGKYVEHLFNAEDGTIARIAYYSDKDLKTKNGLYTTFHPNGMMKDSGYYVNNQKQGTHIGWYDEGEQHYVKQYKNDLPVDTGFTFRDDGTMASVTITDSLGNGIYQQYHTNGKVMLIGNLTEGVRNGPWTLKREDGSKRMDLIYLKDSIVQTACYADDGVTRLPGDCIFEKPASYPGGIKQWGLFLQRNLRYPHAAIDKNIEGIVAVQFVVDKEGNASEFQIISSPDPLLSNEVLRLMNKSGKWEPAIQYNQKVIYRHIQTVSFRLR